MPDDKARPFEWKTWEDGSGHLETDHGHAFYSFDKHVHEVFSPFRGWTRMDVGWKARAEDDYMNRIRPKEELSMQMAEHGILYSCFEQPIHSEYQFIRKDSVRFVAVSDDCALPVAEFNALRLRMAEAEEAHMSDRTISMCGAAQRIAHGISKGVDKATGQYKFRYEDTDFFIDRDEVMDVAGLMRPQRQRSLDATQKAILSDIARNARDGTSLEY